MNWFYNWIAQGLIAEYGVIPTSDPCKLGDIFFRVVWRKRMIATFEIHQGRGNWVISPATPEQKEK